MFSRIRKRLIGLGRDRKGAVAVEFALVVLPFFIMLTAMVEISYVSFKAAVMEGAAREAARQVRTGVVQNAADAATRFESEFCPNLLGLFACADFYYDVRNFADFSAIVLPDPVYGADGVPQGLQFSPGASNAIVTVRVIHVHSFLTPLVGSLMGGASSSLPLIATVVFRTEPYE